MATQSCVVYHDEAERASPKPGQRVIGVELYKIAVALGKAPDYILEPDFFVWSGPNESGTGTLLEWTVPGTEPARINYGRDPAV